MAALSTGGDVDTFCSKCQLELAHVIIAMNGSRILRVECKTCRGPHAYKAPAAKATRARPSRAAGATPRATSRSGGASANAYARVVAGRDLDDAQPYRPQVTYGEGDVVAHGSFGVGVVTRVLADRKVALTFPAGTKVLVHGRD